MKHSVTFARRQHHSSLAWAMPSLPVFIGAFLCCAMVTLLIVGGVKLSLLALIVGYGAPVAAHFLMVIGNGLAALAERGHFGPSYSPRARAACDQVLHLSA